MRKILAAAAVAAGLVVASAVPAAAALTSVPNGSTITLAGSTLIAQSPNRPYSLQVDTADANHERYELREGDRWSSDVEKFPNDNRQRVMLRDKAYQPFNTVLWLAGDVRYNTTGFRQGYDGYYAELLCTYHLNDSGENGSFKKAEVQLAIRLDSAGKPRLQLSTSGDPTGKVKSTSAQRTVRYNQPFVLDHWYRIVMRLKFTPGNKNASIAVWLDGQKVVDATGITMGYNDAKGPYLKRGIYSTGDSNTRVADWANVKIGTTSLLDRVTSPPPLPVG